MHLRADLKRVTSENNAQHMIKTYFDDITAEVVCTLWHPERRYHTKHSLTRMKVPIIKIKLCYDLLVCVMGRWYSYWNKHMFCTIASRNTRIMSLCCGGDYQSFRAALADISTWDYRKAVDADIFVTQTKNITSARHCSFIEIMSMVLMLCAYINITLRKRNKAKMQATIYFHSPSIYQFIADNDSITIDVLWDLIYPRNHRLPDWLNGISLMQTHYTAVVD